MRAQPAKNEHRQRFRCGSAARYLLLARHMAAGCGLRPAGAARRSAGMEGDGAGGCVGRITRGHRLCAGAALKRARLSPRLALVPVARLPNALPGRATPGHAVYARAPDQDLPSDDGALRRRFTGAAVRQSIAPTVLPGGRGQDSRTIRSGPQRADAVILFLQESTVPTEHAQDATNNGFVIYRERRPAGLVTRFFITLGQLLGLLLGALNASLQQPAAGHQTSLLLVVPLRVVLFFAR